MKTRIATFKNGLGQLIYRIEYRYWFLPIWFTYGSGDQIAEFWYKDEAEQELASLLAKKKRQTRVRVKTT